MTDALLVEVEISNMSQEDLKLSVSYGIAEFNRDTMKTLDELSPAQTRKCIKTN